MSLYADKMGSQIAGADQFKQERLPTIDLFQRKINLKTIFDFDPGLQRELCTHKYVSSVTSAMRKNTG